MPLAPSARPLPTGTQPCYSRAQQELADRLGRGATPAGPQPKAPGNWGNDWTCTHPKAGSGTPCGYKNWGKRWKCGSCELVKPWTTKLDLSYLLSKFLWERFENRSWCASVPLAAGELGCLPEDILELVATQVRDGVHRYLLFEGEPDCFFVVLAKLERAGGPAGMRLVEF